MLGKKRRLKRVLRDGRTLIIPMDHGLTKVEEGIERIDEILKDVSEFIDAVVLHKGAAKFSKVISELDVGLIIHLSGSTNLGEDPNDKRIVSSVESALKLGADAVSVHVNIGSKTEGRQLEDLGSIAEKADDYGMPLLAMMYPRGKVDVNIETVTQAARVAYELGADIVKVPFVESFDRVTRFCKIPVVIAGGSKESEFELLKKVEKAILSGAVGAAVGRNVFCHPSPRDVARALYLVIHENITAEEVFYERNLVASR